MKKPPARVPPASRSPPDRGLPGKPLLGERGRRCGLDFRTEWRARAFTSSLPQLAVGGDAGNGMNGFVSKPRPRKHHRLRWQNADKSYQSRRVWWGALTQFTTLVLGFSFRSKRRKNPKDFHKWALVKTEKMMNITIIDQLHAEDGLIPLIKAADWSHVFGALGKTSTSVVLQNKVLQEGSGVPNMRRGGSTVFTEYLGDWWLFFCSRFLMSAATHSYHFCGKVPVGQSQKTKKEVTLQNWFNPLQ